MNRKAFPVLLNQGIEETQLHPWDRQPGESMLWFSRFEAFRLLGPCRTVERSGQRKTSESRGKPKPLSGHWYEAAKQWSWKSRAEAWDMMNLAEAEKELEEWKVKSRKARREVLDAALNKSFEALDLIDPANLDKQPGIGEVTNAIVRIVDSLRNEAGEAGIKIQAEVKAVPYVHNPDTMREIAERIIRRLPNGQ